MICIVPIS